MQNQCSRAACPDRGSLIQRIAEFSLRNGTATSTELEETIQAAQRARITEFEYLRSRLLTEAGVAADDESQD
jgi:hypothetical protein